VSRTSDSLASGLPYALGAHVVWGSMPLYLLLVQGVPPLEFVAWRLVFTLPLCLVFVAAPAVLAAVMLVPGVGLGSGRTMAGRAEGGG